MAGDLVTQPWHVEWRGRLFGWPLTGVTLNGLTGWLETAPARSVMTPRSGRHGSFAGAQTLGSRTIECSFTFTEASYNGLIDLRHAFAVVDEDPEEEPLVIWAGTPEPEMVFARVEKAAIPSDYEFSLGVHRATIQFTASSAMRYSVGLQSKTIPLSALTGSGLPWPLAWPLSWGTASGGGQIEVTNIGTATAWPNLILNGAGDPVPAGFVITDATTGRRLRFSDDFAIAAGQQVIVDTDNRYVSMNGVSRDDKLVERQWFGLPPRRPTTLLFSATTPNPAATLTVEWRHTSSL